MGRRGRLLFRSFESQLSRRLRSLNGCVTGPRSAPLCLCLSSHGLIVYRYALWIMVSALVQLRLQSPAGSGLLRQGVWRRRGVGASGRRVFAYISQCNSFLLFPCHSIPYKFSNLSRHFSHNNEVYLLSIRLAPSSGNYASLFGRLGAAGAAADTGSPQAGGAGCYRRLGSNCGSHG